MHLRSLRLRGFKSFPETVEIRLEPGVAVVVGPNGSGKSNVADAIVWAAGSLTPSELRAEKPDDVLFAGGGDRKAVDACEVELVFDNEDGGLADLPFSEVSIMRRLARGGEGQYLVNRAAVRRTDLVELLADVGLGGAMHSIVSQGKVDAVLASRPEDRRALVEEAAGLGKFKRRRHRAELKLARVGIQVERARDVEDEVRKRLRPLALQATAAERAEKLRHEIARLRARVADLDLAAIADRRAEADERRVAAALARRGSAERLQGLLEQRQRAEEELGDAAGRREAAVGSLYRLRSATERLELRREAAESLLARSRAELEELRLADETRDDAALTALEHDARVAAAAAREAAMASGGAAERARLAHERLAALDASAAREAEQMLAGLHEQRAVAEAELSSLAGGREGAAATLLRLRSARERLALRHESAAALVDGLRQELDEAKAAASGGPDPAELEREATEAAAAARLAATERDDLRERARAAGERLAALELSLAEREGIPPAARALAESGERLALSLLDAEPGTERAIAAALGSRASAVLADDASAGFALLERARAAGLGSLTVLIGADPSALVASLPVVPASELLAQTAPAVTAEGFGYDPGRGELWFAGETAEAVLLEQDARRRALAEEKESLSVRAAAAAREAEASAARAERAEAAYASVAHLRSRHADPATLARLLGGAESLIAVLTASIATAERLEDPIRVRADEQARGAADLGDRLRTLGAQEAEARRTAAEAAARAQAAAVVVARLGGNGGEVSSVDPNEDREQLATTAATLLAEAEALAAEAAEAAERARVAGAALAERSPHRPTADPGVISAVASGAERLVALLLDAASAAARFEPPLQARVDLGATRTTELAADLRRLGAAEVEERQRAEEAAERASAVDVELARLDAEAAEARRRRHEADTEEAAEGDDREELAAKAERLDRRREELGKVNPLAKEEYEAEKERLEELSTQREDLERSLAELGSLRDELAETVARRFDETFTAVARNFEEVATTLFPGGEGRLRLVQPEEGDGGEPGIEVELRPAGKRITRLSLLSGGEKALGAISFLFALFLAKPCPFYLLDEVEAALDDANIARFVELLRRYADRAQFVVITHQKRTMEAADVLYGVTMGPDGVSQIVSRRLPREREAVAAAS